MPYMTPESWQDAALYLSGFSGLLLVIGIVTPLWIYIIIDGDYSGIGLFYRIGSESDGIRLEPDEFGDFNLESDSTLRTDHWMAMTVLEIFAAVMALVVVIMLFFFRQRSRKGKYVRTLSKAAFYGAIITWACNVISLIVFTIYHGNALYVGLNNNSRSFSWSILFCFIAGFLHFFLIVMIYLQFRLKKRDINAIPVAADPRMHLIPSAKMGETNRYFQSPLSPLDLNDDYGSRLGTRMAIMPPAPLDFSEARDNFAYGQTLSPPALSPMRTLGHRYSHSDFGNDVYRNGGTTTVLNRDFDDILVNRSVDDNMVFNRPFTNEGRRRHSLIGELEAARGGDYLATARQVLDRGIHRNDGRYLAHTARPLVLSPSNLAETTTKYNPTYMYRPYSQQVY